MWQRDLPDFLNTEAMRRTNCNIDHVMIKFTTKLRVRRKIKTDKMSVRKLATNTIWINRIRYDQQALLNDRLAKVAASSVEEKWNAFE